MGKARGHLVLVVIFPHFIGIFLFFLCQIFGQSHTCLVEEFAKRWHALHQSGKEVGSACLAVACATAVVPNRYLVDADALDGFDLRLHQVGKFLQEEQCVSLRCIASGSLNHLVVALGLLGQNLKQTLGLGLHLGEDGVGLSLGYPAGFFCLGFGLALVIAVVVTLVTKAPAKEINDEFEKVNTVEI